jgi:hypothetical protein
MELKCLYKNTDMSFLENKLFTSDLSFHEAFPPRYINSIYYDNNSLTSIDESLNGNGLRSKVRLRWYGKLIQDCYATLEIKKKESHLSWKFLMKNSCRVNSEMPTWKELVTHNETVILPSLLSVLENKFPTSIVRYKRKYFVSADGTVRVTIDNQLEFYDQINFVNPNFRYCDNSTSGIILEIKLPQQYINKIHVLGNSINFIPCRFSKYCESMSSHNLHSS